jgi:hypothetical protein
LADLEQEAVNLGGQPREVDLPHFLYRQVRLAESRHLGKTEPAFHGLEVRGVMVINYGPLGGERLLGPGGPRPGKDHQPTGPEQEEDYKA